MAVKQAQEKWLQHIVKKLYRSHRANHSGATFTAEFEIGEVGDRESALQTEILKEFVRDKILKSVDYKKYLVESRDGDSYYSDANCVVNRKKFLNFAIGQSFIPKFILFRDSDRRILLDTQYSLFRFSKPDFKSENDVFIESILSSKSKVIKIVDIEKKFGLDTKGKVIHLNKNPSACLRDLKLNHEFGRMFFPNTSKTAVEVRNPIYQNDFTTLGINEKALKEQISRLQKLRNFDVKR